MKFLLATTVLTSFVVSESHEKLQISNSFKSSFEKEFKTGKESSNIFSNRFSIFNNDDEGKLELYWEAQL